MNPNGDSPQREGQTVSLSDEDVNQLYQDLYSLWEELGDLRNELEETLQMQDSSSPVSRNAATQELFRTASTVSEQLHDEAEGLHKFQMQVVGEWVDPMAIARETFEQHGRSFSDNFARPVWQDHEELRASDLNSIAEKLRDIQEGTRNRIMLAMKENAFDEEIPEWLQEEIDTFTKAWLREPIIEYMAEQAALNGPTPPSWDKLRWQERVQMELSGVDATVDVLRCLYLLLIQQERDFSGATELYETIGAILGQTRTSVINALKRGLSKTNTAYLEALTTIPNSSGEDVVAEWRRWLDGKTALKIPVNPSQKSV
jgi:hypothetical protein